MLYHSTGDRTHDNRHSSSSNEWLSAVSGRSVVAITKPSATIVDRDRHEAGAALDSAYCRDLTSTSKETWIIGAQWLFLNQVGAPEWKFEQLPGLYMVENLDTFRDRSTLPEDIVNATVDCLRIVKENQALVQGGKLV
jgi:hypothetical protein